MEEPHTKTLLAQSDRMFGARASTETLWQELADQFYPERGTFTYLSTQGEEFASHLHATEPVMMRRDLGNAISGMTRPGSRQWAKLDIGEDNPGPDNIRHDIPTRTFLDWIMGVQWRHMYDPSANLVRATKAADQDLVTFGNAVLCIEPNLAAGRLCHSCMHLKDCAWQDNAKGQTDLMHRRFRLTARQAKQKFSRENDKLHESIHTACEKDQTKDFDFLHIMLPVEDYDYVNKPLRSQGNAAFVSIYLDRTNSTLVREAPSAEFRYVVQRWHAMPGTPYAISPATMTALPEARMMQALSRIVREAGEKSIDPPLKVTEEAIRGEVNLYASGLTWVDREYDERLGPALEPIVLGKSAGLGLTMFDRLRNVLMDAFYLNKLVIPQQAEKTAFETQQLIEENLRASAPLFEPMEQNNAAILEAQFAILLRMGAFGRLEDWPRTLSGSTLRFTFTNPLHDAIERAKVMQFHGISQMAAVGGQLDPSIVAHLDMAEAFRDGVLGSGAPAKWLKSRQRGYSDAAAMNQKAETVETMAGINLAGQAAEAVGNGAQAVRRKRTA